MSDVVSRKALAAGPENVSRKALAAGSSTPSAATSGKSKTPAASALPLTSLGRRLPCRLRRWDGG